MKANLLGDTYKQMYEGYYDAGITGHRGLVARDTIDHIYRVIGGDRFQTALDIGAGDGSLLEALNDGAIAQKLHAVEISESGLRAIRARALNRLVRCDPFDGYALPYEDQSVDLLLSIHVMEHVEHERLALAEMRRVGRRIVIEVPIEHNIRVDRSIAVGKEYGHINFYSPPVFLARLESCGFRVLRSKVLTQSLAYERLCSGTAVGSAKYFVRRGLLGALPKLAPFLLTYTLTVYAEPR